ncbi:MAG: hypothetical protein IPL35_13185 [Sphingobacteriales bacterium]|nr:hypothetical protein [Sphingobacteriales bacterium]
MFKFLLNVLLFCAIIYPFDNSIGQFFGKCSFSLTVDAPVPEWAFFKVELTDDYNT